MTRNCDACDQPYEAKTKRSRYCAGVACVRARKRKAEHARRHGQGAEVVQLQPRPAERLTLEAAARARLAEVELAETDAGVAVLILAHRIDHSSSDSGSGVASLMKEYRAAMFEALKDAAQAADPIDQLGKAATERRLSVVR